MKKLLRGYRALLSYLGLKFPQSQPKKATFYIRISKVIGLANCELRIVN